MRSFITPTAVHLGSVLVTSVILTIPSLVRIECMIMLVGGGFAGMASGLVVKRR